MKIRSASMVVVAVLMAGMAQPLVAMTIEPVSLNPQVRRASLPEPADRALVIRRSVDSWAVRAIQGGGWAVPIVGSVRILAARFEPW